MKIELELFKWVAFRPHTDATVALDSAISGTCPSGEDILFFLSCGPRCSRRPVAWVPEAGPRVPADSGAAPEGRP